MGQEELAKKVVAILNKSWNNEEWASLTEEDKLELVKKQLEQHE